MLLGNFRIKKVDFQPTLSTKLQRNSVLANHSLHQLVQWDGRSVFPDPTVFSIIKDIINSK